MAQPWPSLATAKGPVAVEDGHGQQGAPVRAASRAAPGRGLFTRPSFWRVPSRNTPVAQPSSSRAWPCECFSVTGSPSHGIGPAGSDQAAEQGNSEQFRFGHEGHRTAEGMTQQRRVEVGSVVRHDHKGTLHGHPFTPLGRSAEQTAEQGEHQQSTDQSIGQARFRCGQHQGFGGLAH